MKIILASSSPRRIELLTQAGFRFERRSPEADERPRKGEAPRVMVKRLAREKAYAVLGRREKANPVITISADTIVVDPSGKKVLGKPRSRREAERMLASLSGRTHTVVSAYCILEQSHETATHELVRVVTSKVTIRKLSRSFIRQYVRSGEPMDKAGAYAAQGMGMCFIEGIRGSYTNVVGLPMSQLLSDLERFFGVAAPMGKRR